MTFNNPNANFKVTPLFNAAQKRCEIQTYTVSKKLDPFSFEHNFRKYCLILIILSLLQTEIICP